MDALKMDCMPCPPASEVDRRTHNKSAAILGIVNQEFGSNHHFYVCNNYATAKSVFSLLTVKQAHCVDNGE